MKDNRQLAIDLSRKLATDYPTHVAHCVLRSSELVPFCDYSLNGLVLDLGCGDGAVASAMLGEIQSEPSIVGFDIDESSLRRAKSRRIYVDLVRGNASNLPFRDGAFSEVYSVSVMEHILAYQAVLAEVSRVLIESGSASISVVNADRYSDQDFFARLFEAFRAKRVRKWHIRWHMLHSLHFVRLSPELWARDCELAKLKVTRLLTLWDDTYMFYASMLRYLMLPFSRAPLRSRQRVSDHALSFFWKRAIILFTNIDHGSCSFLRLEKVPPRIQEIQLSK